MPRASRELLLECRSIRPLPLSVSFGPLQTGGSCDGRLQPLVSTPASGGRWSGEAEIGSSSCSKVPLLGRLSQPGGRARDLLQGT